MPDDLPSSRSVALAQGISRYFTGNVCPRGNVSVRRTSDGNCICVPCSLWRRARHKANLDAWIAKNPDKVKAIKQRSADKHREKTKAKHSQYKRENRAKVRADTRWRQTLKAQATPAWVDRAAIEAIYVEARRLERVTGVAHHVDHIIPLRGKAVRGLHVPWNLQAIPAKENYIKGASCPS